MNADLKHLRIVIAAADCGSFSSAAAHLNTEVSAVSRAIRDIEQTLGVAIFDRHPRGVELTAAGLSYVASARDLLDRHERAGVHARLAGQGRALNLTVGFPWSVASEPLVQLLRTYAAASSEIEFEVVEASNDELIERCRSGRLDVAIAVTDPPPLMRLKDVRPLVTLPLWLEPLAVAVPENVVVEEFTWTELTSARLLCRTVDDWPRFVRHVERVSGVMLMFEPHAVSQAGVLGLVSAGIGWTILPSSLRHLLPGNVRAVPITSPGAALQVEAIWHPSNANRALAVFTTRCLEAFPAALEATGASL